MPFLQRVDFCNKCNVYICTMSMSGSERLLLFVTTSTLSLSFLLFSMHQINLGLFFRRGGGGAAAPRGSCESVVVCWTDLWIS